MSKNCCNKQDSISCCPPLPTKNIDLIFALITLGGGLLLEEFVPEFEPFSLFWFLGSYLLVTCPVFKEAFELLMKKDWLNELTLMIVATIGAFSIEMYSEGLAVMVFYRVGEFFQDIAVTKTKSSISQLLDMRPDIVTILTAQGLKELHPKEININDIIEIKVGERIALDGVLISDDTYVNSVALTGESLPQFIRKGEEVLSGMIPLNSVIRLSTTKTYENSTLSRILTLVQESSKNKAPAEEMIRRIARYYTPTVFAGAILLVIIPFFFISDYVFSDWLYRSMVFLVISCPCALVVSVPLTFFSGIGVAAKNGVLFKGGNYLNTISSVKVLLTDKTGTMTKGKLSLQKIISDIDTRLLLSYLCSLEQKSNHPIAKSIVAYAEESSIPLLPIMNFQEIMGKGISGTYNEQEILAGTYSFLKERTVSNLLLEDQYNIVSTPIFVAVSGKYVGYVEVLDELRENTKEFVQKCHEMNIHIAMLSGDRNKIVEYTANKLGIDECYGELLPDQKIETALAIKEKHSGKRTAFLGDGINDAPLLSISDIGIAMGGFGSELAIESADIVIQNDDPMKFLTAIDISKATSYVVWQNIIFALLVKLIFIVMGAFGLTSMWFAVFADVGVTILSILNALRLQYYKVK
ncbi:MAG: heavy metal translocating P-type ATPase [Brevinema sp.]